MERQVAIVAYQGVLADESHAFRAVLRRAPGVHLFTVGARVGVVAGPGGAQVVDATFADIRSASIVVVPGGLGSHRHPEIAAWTLRDIGDDRGAIRMRSSGRLYLGINDDNLQDNTGYFTVIVYY